MLAFLADEEAGGNWGARWLVDNHAHLFEGVTEAISEVGGFSTTIGGQRLYLLQTAEKGMAWMRLTARGTAGHGSMLHADNAVTELAETVARIGRHEWPIRLTPSASGVPGGRREALGVEFTPDAAREVLAKLGPLARMVGATLTNTANPTMLNAGYKVNVVPGAAGRQLDGRFLPGYEDEFLAELDSLLGPAASSREFITTDIAVETTFDGALCDAMTARSCWPRTRTPGSVPYCMSGGTDAKSFSRLGIRCFGFAPAAAARGPGLLLACSTAIDERVPVDALRFGVQGARPLPRPLLGSFPLE